MVARDCRPGSPPDGTVRADQRSCDSLRRMLACPAEEAVRRGTGMPGCGRRSCRAPGRSTTGCGCATPRPGHLLPLPAETARTPPLPGPPSSRLSSARPWTCHPARGGLASFLRRRQLGVRLNGPSLPGQDQSPNSHGPPVRPGPGACGYSARRAEAVRARAAQPAGASAPAAAMTRPDSASKTSSQGTYTSSTEAGTPVCAACAITGST